MNYTFQLVERGLLYAPSHRQDITYHCLCYTSCEGSIRLPIAPWAYVLFPNLNIFLSRTEEPVKAITCAHDRCVLQQLALNVHFKHSDLTWPAEIWLCHAKPPAHFGHHLAADCTAHKKPWCSALPVLSSTEFWFCCSNSIHFWISSSHTVSRSCDWSGWEIIINHKILVIVKNL